MEFTSIQPSQQNVSLIAFYGNKPPELINLIQQLQSYLVKELPEQFYPYPLPQIHGTLIGYEGIKTDRGILNYWFWKHRKQEKYINLSGAIEYIYKTNLLPLKIRFGGYQADIDYGFVSQDISLFERSFQVLNNLAILIGWPVRRKQVSLDVAQLRLGFQSFNLLHKYHPKADSLDNDFYMRIGILKVKLSDKKLREIENKIRNALKANFPLDVSIELENLSLVGYQDTSLPMETTKIISLKEANLAEIELLYS